MDPHWQEFILLSDVLGVSAIIDAPNNPAVGNATESGVLEPFFMDGATDRQFNQSMPSPSVPPLQLYLHLSCPVTSTVPLRESFLSDGKEYHMYIEGRVSTSSGEPVPGAVIKTREVDNKGEQHSN